MSSNLQILIALLLYLAFFGWVGWRRGTFQELAVFAVAGPTWFLLQSQGSIFVRIANLGGKFMAFLRSGGLGGDPADAFQALGDAPDVITAETQPFFFFMLWVLLVVLVYVVTNVFLKMQYRDGWAILLGMANGLLLGAILLPRLLAPLLPGIDTNAFLQQNQVTDVLVRIRGVLSDGLESLWALMEPQSSVVLLLLITMLLLLAATSLRGGKKAEEG